MNLHVTDKDHVQGPADAKIELVEYADYQCPYCRKAYYIVKDIQKELGKDVKFIFRNFPLAELHANAMHAAIATETAALQGEFWKMHDMLFENQRNLDDTHLMEYAKRVGLNTELFKENFGNEATYGKVKKDYDSGVQAGVEGTPTFFVNGEVFEGNWMDAEFVDYLRELIR